MINVYPSTWFRRGAHAEGSHAWAAYTGEGVRAPRLIVGRVFQIAYAFDGETLYLSILNQDAVI